MLRHFLLAPGPTPIPEQIRLESAKSIIHHRGDGFREVFADIRKNLKWLVETDREVLTVTSSGTGAFEAALANFTRSDDTIVSIGGGKFGQRWGDMAERYGMAVERVDVPWGEAVDPDKLADILDEHPDCSMVTLTASETSTGVYHPVRRIGEVVADKSDALFAVDGVTSVGVHPMPMDDLGIDVLVTGSQKAFGIPPGLGFVAASQRAWKAYETSDHPKYYFDLGRELKKQKNNQTAFTPAITVVVALRHSLRRLREEGKQNVFERHRINAEATRQGVRALGLEPLADRPSNAVTAVLTPDGILPDEIVDTMRRDHNCTIAGGQKHFSSKLFRLGHLGFFDRSDILVGLSSLELVLEKLGLDIETGDAITAAQRCYRKEENN